MINSNSDSNASSRLGDANSLSDDELMLYARQILLPEWDVTAQLNLKSSAVYIIGVGGLGCVVAQTLARAGVGHIHLIDDDSVSLSNLQRQCLYTIHDVGQPKVTVAKARLEAMNPWITITAHHCRLSQDADLSAIVHALKGQPSLTQKNNATATIQPHLKVNTVSSHTTLLIDCSDNFTVRDLINRFSVAHHIPLLSASAIAQVGQLALYEPEQDTGCYHCVFGDESWAEQNNQAHDNLQKGERLTDNDASIKCEANCATSGVLASTVMVMGSQQAHLALQYLGLGRNPLAGILLLWDGINCVQRIVGYQKDKHCSVCGIK